MKKNLFILMACVFISLDASAKLETLYRNALVFAYSQVNSIYEDDNIKLEIYNEELWAFNKTKKTIFIDKSQCFLVHNGSSFPMEAKNQDERHASKNGESTSIDEFITIALSTGAKQNETFICNIATNIYGEYTTTESPIGDFTNYDKRLLETINELVTKSMQADPKGKQCLGTTTKHFTEDESVNNIGASIAYAFNKKAEDWNSVSISTWVSDVIFAPCYVQMPKDLTKKEKKGFGVKETDPAIVHVKADSPFEFDADKSPIIVCDWVGNFKKGTFTLETTSISKVKKPGLLLSILTYGMASLYTQLDTQNYKKIIQFDGANAEWGNMSYAKTISESSQKN